MKTTNNLLDLRECETYILPPDSYSLGGGVSLYATVERQGTTLFYRGLLDRGRGCLQQVTPTRYYKGVMRRDLKRYAERYLNWNV